MSNAVMPPARAITALAVTAPAAIRGASRIACDAIEQVTNIVESMHANIAAAPPPLSRRVRTRTRGITGLVYDSIRLVNSATRATLDKALSLVAADFGPSLPQPHADHALSALNGVIGDYLEATGNPLAIRMQMRRDGQPVTPESLRASRRLLVLVHGLCMNDRQWTINGHDHGDVLARQAGYTPIYLFYNTGRHISENGRDFADKLEAIDRSGLSSRPLDLRRGSITERFGEPLVHMASPPANSQLHPFPRDAPTTACGRSATVAERPFPVIHASSKRPFGDRA